MPRIIVRIEISPEAWSQMAKVREQRGHTSVMTMSRLCEWFAQQPEDIFALTVGSIPESIRADVAKLAMKKREARGRA